MIKKMMTTDQIAIKLSKSGIIAPETKCRNCLLNVNGKLCIASDPPKKLSDNVVGCLGGWKEVRK